MNDTRQPEPYRCGLVALVGRPNVGKSTLLNHLLGQKLSITAHKPQTTRHPIVGIHTTDDAQIVYVDTPGLHKGGRRALNRYLNRAARNALEGVDLVVFVAEALRWTPEDELVLDTLEDARVPVILAASKVDRIRDKTRLLPWLAEMAEKREFAELIPVSATREVNLPELEQAIVRRLPERPPLFEPGELTDRPARFLAAELVREKLMRKLDQELPYELTVETEHFSEEEDGIHISAIVWVERESHKKIVIGKGGRVLKAVGTEARRNMEDLFGRHVRLSLWVKVRPGWTRDERALRELGYEA